MPSASSAKNLIPTSEVIKKAKNKGVYFGHGKAKNRIKYLINLNILPNKIKKFEDGNQVSYLPSWVVDRLVKVQEMRDKGKSFKEIANILKNKVKESADSNVAGTEKKTQKNTEAKVQKNKVTKESKDRGNNISLNPSSIGDQRDVFSNKDSLSKTPRDDEAISSGSSSSGSKETSSNNSTPSTSSKSKGVFAKALSAQSEGYLEKYNIKKGAKIAAVVSLLVLLVTPVMGSASNLALNNANKIAEVLPFFDGLQLQGRTDDPEPLDQFNVITDESSEEEQEIAGVFKVNIPAQFKNAQFNQIELGELSISGEDIEGEGVNLDLGNQGNVNTGNLSAGSITANQVTASNILYSLQQGDGVTITEGQNPTITNSGVLSLNEETGSLELTAGDGISIDGLNIENTDKGSDQSIFKTVEVEGSSNISAGSNNDAFGFKGGTGVSLSTSGSDITINASGSALNVSGWEAGGSNVYLKTSSDNVGIGTSNPSSKLEVAGDLTFSSSGKIDLASGGIINAGPITGATGLTSSGQITFSSLSTGVVKSNGSGVLSSSAVDLSSSDVTNTLTTGKGGTGLTGFTAGDILYAQNSSTLTKLNVGADGEVLTVSSGTPAWGTVSGSSSCSNCIVEDPNSTQTITPQSSTATGLSVRQASSGSVDIFNVTSNDGNTKYLTVDNNGNVTLGESTSQGTFTVSPTNTDPIAIDPVAEGAGAFTGTITSADLTADRTWTIPDSNGTFCLTSGNCSGTSSALGGSGTSNYIAKWGGQYSLTDSILYGDGTNIGIGHTDPTSKLYVSGDGTYTGNLGVQNGLDVTGANFTVGGSSFTVAPGTGNTDIDGTLGVAGATTLSSTLDVTSHTTIGGNLNVDGTGDSYVMGNLGVGTSSPGTALEVDGIAKIGPNLSQSGTFTLLEVGNTTAAQRPAIKLLGELSANFQMEIKSGSNLDVSLGNGVTMSHSGGSGGFGVVGTSDVYLASGNGPGNLSLTRYGHTNITAGGDRDNSVRAMLYVDQGSTNQQDNILQLADQGDTKFVVKSSGNVGIGTTAPSYKMAIVGDGADNLFNVVDNTTDVFTISDTQAITIGSYLRFNDSNSSTLHINRTVPEIYNMNEDNLVFQASTGATPGSDGYLTFVTNDSGSSGTVERLRIANDGNVGIGTTAPNANLEVWGGSDADSTVRVGDSNDFWDFVVRGSQTVEDLELRPNGSTAFDFTRDGKLQFAASNGIEGTSRPAIYGNNNSLILQPRANTGSGAIKFNTYDGSSGATERFRITQEGKVGIGTTSPNTKLDIEDGNIELNNGYGLGTPGNTATLALSNDRVGIGTTGPNGDLHVQASDGSSVLRIEDTSTNSLARLMLQNDAQSWWLQTQGADDFVIRDGTAGNNVFTIQNNAPEGSFYVNASGNVGIGTTSPSAKLQVTNSNLQQRLAYDASNYFDFDVQSDGALFMGQDGSSEQFAFKDGNVGIGTSSPGASIQIKTGTGSIATGLALDSGNVGIYEGSGESLQFVADGINRFNVDGNRLSGRYSTGAQIFGKGGSITSPLYTMNGDDNTGLGLSGSDEVSLVTGGIAHVYVNSSGNVGIGTTDPQSILNLAGGTGSLSTGLSFGDGDSGIYENSDDSLFISINNDVVVKSDASKLYGGESGSWSLTDETASTTNPTIQPYLGDYDTGIGGNGTNVLSLIAGGTNGLNVEGSGKVGIGTTSPSDQLDILGTSTQLRLSYDGSNYTQFTVDSSGEISIAPNGTTAARFSDSAANFDVPTSFNAAGDVSIANDLKFTNQTASYMQSNAPLTLQVGEAHESNDLTLQTYNSGDVVFDAAGGLTSLQAQDWDLADSTTALNVESGLLNLDTSNSRVGVGTTSPNSDLHINDSSGSYAEIILEASGHANRSGIISFDSSDGQEAEIKSYQGGLTFRVNGTDIGLDIANTGNVNIPNGNLQVDGMGDSYIQGNVGIGTTSPLKKLHVNSGATNFGALFESADGVAGISLKDSNTTDENTVWMVADSNDMVLGAGGSTIANDGGIRIQSDKDVIINNGNVGIGTTSPSYALEVNNNDGLGLKQEGSGGELGISAVGNTILGSHSPTIKAVSRPLQIYTASSTELLFGTNNTEQMRIDSSGNVGVGTTDPQSNLSVGSASEFRVDSSGDIARINDVAYSFPGSQGASDSVLTNDGSGNLSWASSSGTGTLGYWSRSGTNLSPTNSGDDLHLGSGELLGVGYDPANISNGVAAFNGNVGIGTTAPEQKLHLQNDSGESRFLLKSTSGYAVNELDSNTNQVVKFLENGAGRWLFTSEASTDDFYIYDDKNNNRVITIEDGASEDSLYLKGNNVGIGTTSPGFKLDVSGGQIRTVRDNQTNVIIESYRSSSVRSSLLLRGSRGTQSTPSALTNGHELGKIHFQGYGGSGWVQGAHITAVTADTGTVSDSSFPTDLLFKTTANGSSVPSERMILTSSGNVGIGTTGPDNFVHISPPFGNTSANVPLRLDRNTPSIGGVVSSATMKAVSSGDMTDGFGPLWNFVIQDNGTGEVTSAIMRFGAVRDGADNSGSFVVHTSNAGSSSERFRIDNSGNVGIGTTAPSHNLEIVDKVQSSKHGLSITRTQGSGASGLFLTTTHLLNNDKYHILAESYDSGNPIDVFSVDHAGEGYFYGNVGIGTTSPSYNLDVDGNIRADVSSAGIYTQAFLTNSISAAAGTGSELAFQANRTTSGLTNVAGIAGVITDIDSSNYKGALVFRTADGSFRDEKMRVDHAGNVGIGTTSPQALLNIDGSTTSKASLRLNSGSTPSSPASGDFYSDGTDVFFYNGSSWDDLTTGSVTMQNAYSGGNTVQLTSGNGDIRFYNDSSDDLLFLDEATGNVGIGTTSPNTHMELTSSSNTKMRINTTSLDGTPYSYLEFSKNGNRNAYLEAEQSSGHLTLGAGNSDRMTIYSGGNVGIGGTTPSSKLNIQGLGSSTGTALVIDANGDVYKDSSSRRYKKNINKLNNDFEKVLDLEPVSYEFKGTGAETIGYVAEEIDKLGLEDLVVYDKEGKPDAIKYDRLPIYLLEVLKQQDKDLQEIQKAIEEKSNTDCADEGTTDCTDPSAGSGQAKEELAEMDDLNITEGEKEVLSLLSHSELDSEFSVSVEDTTTNNKDSGSAVPRGVHGTAGSGMTILEINTSASIFGNLNITDALTASSITATGEIRTGMLVFNGDENSINSQANKLKLQNKFGAGAIEAFGGKFVVTPEGNVELSGKLRADSVESNKLKSTRVESGELKTNVLSISTSKEARSKIQETSSTGESMESSHSDGETVEPEESSLSSEGDSTNNEDPSVGEGIITKGQTNVVIRNSNVDEDSKIFVTPTTSTNSQSLIVSNKAKGEFTVALDSTVGHNIEFDYWVIRVK